jgi:hypothetical protein
MSGSYSITGLRSNFEEGSVLSRVATELLLTALEKLEKLETLDPITSKAMSRTSDFQTPR